MTGETYNGGCDIDGRGNHGNGEAAGDTRVLEVLCTVVEDEVDAGQLLESLQRHSGELALENRRPEAVEVRGLADALLKVVVGLDLLDLAKHGRVISRETTDTAEGLVSLVHLSCADEVARGLREEEETNEKDK
jgi:hypothetical protein